ncbi:MAG: site-specific recombinase XerD [Planctomycetota bacterium]|nr:site-specific recombinase XerD [Planctomycetota bacterium]
MDETQDGNAGVLAIVETRGDGHELVVHADLERLRREIAAPPIVREAGPGAEYAYADFFKAKISNPNTRVAYKRAVDRFLGWCRLRGLTLRQVTSFVVGDYVEHFLVDKDGHALSAPTKK